MSFRLSKLVLTFFLVFYWLFMPQYGFSGILSGGVGVHFVYPFCHANIFHLLANLVCFWMIPCESHLLISYLCAVLCSFLPCFCSEPTMGFSGVLFAVVGISWGRCHRFVDMIWKNKLFLIIPLFLPNVNGLLHVYCLVVGYFIGSNLRDSFLPHWSKELL